MKRCITSAILLLLLCSIHAVPLRIHYTNDTHGTYLPRTYSIAGERISRGGYTELEFVLQKSRKEVSRSIYLDAGDQQTGSAFAGLEYKGAIGGAVIEVFNMLKLDASCLGNHEFDISLPNTEKLMSMAKYPFITTNIHRKADDKPLQKPYTIIETDSLRIGVLGLTLMELPEKVKAKNVQALELLPYKPAIDRYLEELDCNSDLIVILTHNGFEADSLLALELDQRIDMIIGGHSHTTLPEPVMVNGILILQSGSYLQNLGVIDLEVSSDRIIKHKNTLLPISLASKPASTDLSRFVDTIRAEIDHSLNKVVGTIPVDWIPDKYAETEVSRWQANALLSEYSDVYAPDLAMINCGGIRKSVPRGDITLKDLSEMLPFNNTISFFSCTGKDLIGFYERHLQKVENRPFDMVQPSTMGFRDVVKSDVAGRSITLRTLFIGDRAVEADSTYRVVSHDYLVGQWDKYLGFEPQDVYDSGDLLLDAIVNQVKKQYGKRP